MAMQVLWLHPAGSARYANNTYSSSKILNGQTNSFCTRALEFHPSCPSLILCVRDTSSESKRTAIAAILEQTIDTCASKGFNAIEPDNLDTFSRSDNLLTDDDNLALAKILADYAHSKDLAFAQKNTGGELEGKGKDVAGFDVRQDLPWLYS